jgi:hypothetical protein
MIWQYGPSAFGNNPFAVLTLIAAPAVFTNASSVLALGTANRLGRAVDRARVLGDKLQSGAASEEEKKLWAAHLRTIDLRTTLLLKALRSFYTCVGAFAAASLVSILGAGLSYTEHRYALEFTIGVGLIAVAIGFSGLVAGGVALVRETRLAVTALREETQLMLRSSGR